jgi:hydroxymethylpyrimidine/phosphomethylpyrimidine kinase
MVAKGGAPLLQQAAIAALKQLLIPHATLLTPNIPEAELLLGRAITNQAAMYKAAEDLLALGAGAVLLKGGHMAGDEITDVLATKNAAPISFRASRIHTNHTHGTGCTMAAAIATFIGRDLPLVDAISQAHAYVQAAIINAPGLGGGHGPLGHNYAVKILQ